MVLVQIRGTRHEKNSKTLLPPLPPLSSTLAAEPPPSSATPPHIPFHLHFCDLSTIKLMNNFDFALTLHLMKKVLSISNELSQALQRKDQDIINVMNLVNITKERLQALRDDG
ncbi:hypothetical protein MTR_0010s0390 [Medicago truncatula]|uniref:Uncharacterized protein n=1 Tax=Medicago truncatula TaxID=3880 RepID=A0A072TVF3_MEDTR|nr:hypothetical protein MTR_0010s0390 [Medicago truncatula]